MLLGAAVLAIATSLTVLTGGYLAVTYNQHSSRGPLTQSGSGPAPVTHPSVAFLDFSPVGLYEDCILGVAKGLGLTWDGGALGWTSAAVPRPTGGAGLDDAKVQAWRDRMSAELGAASQSTAWKACSLPQLSPPVTTSPPPAEVLDINGSYTIDPNSMQAIGGCGSPGPTSMTVSGGGTPSVTVSIAGKTLHGTYDASSNALDTTATDTNGTTQLSVRGSISGNAGVTRFSGEYELLDNTAGCGYQFSAQKN